MFALAPFQLASVLQSASRELGHEYPLLQEGKHNSTLRHTTTRLLRAEESAHAGRAPLLRLPVLYCSNDCARRARDRENDSEQD